MTCKHCGLPIKARYTEFYDNNYVHTNAYVTCYFATIRDPQYAFAEVVDENKYWINPLTGEKFLATPEDEMAAESKAAKKPEQPRVYPKSVPKKSTFALPEVVGRRFRNAK